MSQLKLILLVGTPASGKSTHATTFLTEHPEYNLVCPDHIREQVTGDASDQSANGYIFSQLVPQAIRAASLMRQSVVYDATNVSRKARRPIIKLAKELGYHVIVQVMRTPFDTCVRLNAARERQVPIDVLERMRDQWQEPALDEGVDEIGDVVVDFPLDSASSEDSSANPLDTPPQAAETPLT